MDLAQLAESAIDRLGERIQVDFEGEIHTNLQILDCARRCQRALQESD